MKLQNESLLVEVSPCGAVLSSVQKDGWEYLWQPDAVYWNRSDLVLFPYVGRLTEGKYTYAGKEYAMDIHGFCTDRDFETVSCTREQVTFRICDDEQTRKQYPFRFTFLVTYRLKGNTIEKTYTVKNQDEKTMFFGLGSHPGFRLDGDFAAWKLVFSAPCRPRRLQFHPETILLQDGTVGYPLKDDTVIPLRHDLFDEDAIVLQDVADTVTLCSDQSQRSVTVAYPGTDFISFWHMPKTDAGYVCIEPWCSLPSRHGVTEALETQPTLLSLSAGTAWEKTETITIR